MSDESDVESSDDSDDDDDDEILLSSSDSAADSDNTEQLMTADVKPQIKSEICDDVAAGGDAVPADADTSDDIDIDKLASIIIEDDNEDDGDKEDRVSPAARGSYLDYFSLLLLTVDSLIVAVNFACS